MTYHCERIDLQPQPTLAIRTRTAVQDLPQVLGKSYGAIMQHLAEMGEMPHGAPFVAYYNMDMENLDIEIGFPVGKPLSGKDEIQPGEMPAGQYAATLHIGPYNQVEPAYQALTAWVQEHGYEPSGVAYEIYLNDPDETPPAELKTQILFPIK